MGEEKVHMSIVFIGHANSGKSTTLGHLIHKLGGIDKLKAERERGCTIDVAYDKLESSKYLFTVIDGPGHRKYIENMITGISQADCAVLVIDSRPEAFEKGISKDGLTLEHALLARTLGVEQMICCFNKMDATILKFSKTRYDEIVEKLSPRLEKVGFKPETVIAFVPISGLEGDNMIERSTNLSWYSGPTLLEALDQIFEPKRPAEKKSLRLPVQDVYKIGGIGIVAVGRVETGSLKPGMQVNFAPAEVTKELTALVKSVHRHSLPVKEALPGDIVEFNVTGVPMRELKRGFVASNSKCDRAWEAASFTSKIHVLDQGPGPIGNGYTAMLDCHTSHTPVMFAKILSTIDKISKKEIMIVPEFLKKGDTAIVLMVPAKPVVVETFSEYPPLGRFAVRDMERIIAVGVIQSVDKLLPTREQTLQIESNEVDREIRKLKEEMKLCKCDIKNYGKSLEKMRLEPQLELLQGQLKWLTNEKEKEKGGTPKFKSATIRMIQDFSMQKAKLESLSSSSEIEDRKKVASLERARNTLSSAQKKLEQLHKWQEKITALLRELRQEAHTQVGNK